jgi:hypothetical protein
MSIMWRIEKLFLFLVALIGVGFYYQVDSLQWSPFQSVDASDFARVILVLLWIGILLVYLEHKSEVKKGKPQKENFVEPGITKWLIGTLVCMVAFCALFQIVGYFTTGFVVLVVYMHFLFYGQMKRLTFRDSLKLTGLSVVSSLFLYLIFGVIFDLWLPPGIFI